MQIKVCIEPQINNRIELLAPRLNNILREAALGMNLSIQYEFDKLTVSDGVRSVGIPYAQLIEHFDNDRYQAIDCAVLAAVRYLKSFDMTKQYAKRRVFRTKQRNMRFATSPKRA